MQQVQTDQIERDLNRMRFKRSSLFKKEGATADDWDTLADEYEALEFMANAANCRRRAEKLREEKIE